MKGLVWKVAIVTAVMAVGFLVMLQAQRGMNQAAARKSTDEQAIAPPTSPTADAVAESKTDHANSKSDPFGDPSARREIAPVESPQPAPAAPVSTASASDTGAVPSPKSSEKSPPVGGTKTASATSDPFAENNDDKHAPHADVRQASGSTEAGKAPELQPGNPSNKAAESDNSGPKVPDLDFPDAKGAPPAGAVPNSPKPSGTEPKPETSKPKDAKADELKLPPTQSEPGAGPQIEAPVQSAPSGGPQLPGMGPALEPPTAKSPPAQSEPDASSSGQSKSAAIPTPSDTKPADKGPTAPAPAESGPALLPAPEISPTTPSATPKSGEQPGPKSDLKDAAASDGPKPFPSSGAKEVPLTLPAPSGNLSEPTKPKSPVFDLTPPASPPPKTADAGAATPPKPSGESRADSAGDFQGDGTVGDAAPLGPQRPQLNVEKVAPPNALIGQPLIYSILIKNVGQSAARDVVVEDRIPKGSKLSGTIPRAELTGKKLLWRLGSLGAGDERKISIRVIPLEAGEIGSVATVNFVAEAAAETVVTAPRLEFKISAPSAARLGQLVPFRFEVRNVGTGEARGVVIRDLIPQGLSHSAGNDLEYEVGRLGPGKSKQLTLDLKAGKIGTAVNRAIVLAEGGLTTEAKAAIEISGSKVALSRTGPTLRYLGRQAVYTNTLVNESTFAVDGVVLVEAVPTGMEFAGASHGGQYNDGSRTIAWRIEQMAPGETRVVKSRLVPRTVGSLASTVRLTVPNGEPVEASTQTQVEGFAAIGLDVDGVDGPVELGERFTLKVNARNKGTVAMTNVVVTIDLPEQVEVVSARGPGKPVKERGQLRFGPIPSLEGRTAATCEIVLAGRKRGDSRVRVSIQADQIDKPLAREESIVILSDAPEAAAAR